MRFFQQFWKQKNSQKSRRSAFGGEVKSKEEVRALHHSINQYEKKEFEEFEKEFDVISKDLWKK